MTDDPFTLTVVAAIGLAVGSFLNVCAYRLPRGQSTVRPPSRCPSCERQLPWYENVPVVAYLLLRGRCRSCRSRISVMYPLVELSTAALFGLHYWQLGWQPLLLPRLVFAGAMVVLFVIDLQHRLLPNVITLPGIVLGFAFSLVMPPGWVSSGIGILIGGGVLLATAEVYYRLRREEGMGMGDVKMLAMIGAFLGWQLALLSLVLSSFIGSLVGGAMVLSGQGNLKYALPFGTFLAIAAIVSSLVGDPILAWYLSFY